MLELRVSPACSHIPGSDSLSSPIRSTLVDVQIYRGGERNELAVQQDLAPTLVILRSANPFLSLFKGLRGIRVRKSQRY